MNIQECDFVIDKERAGLGLNGDFSMTSQLIIITITIIITIISQTMQ